MSRLDSVIRRLIAQRDILNHIAADLELPPMGDILELGLGNGRTFHHLREIFPNRRIIAFDRALAAHQSSVPEAANLILGEIATTARAYIGNDAALVHVDIATAYPDKDAETLTWLPELAAGLLVSGGLCASGLPLARPDLRPLPIPDGIAPDRYYLYVRA